ncbi:MAG: SPOR domain-containing protein [Gammaproteobacteria bacterium]|nr:SPOR domain-containing protein [Gammaproteobacteria bacterium]
MPIKIKTVRGVALTNLILSGLIACSNTPAPWTQANDSPWSEKHQAEAQSIPPEDSLSNTSLNDPVLLAETEPEMEADLIVMQEPEAAPAPEVIAPVIVEDAPVDQNILAMLSTNYAVQVLASKSADNVQKFKDRHGLDKLTTVKTNNAGSIMYVLVDIYPDRARAEAAAAMLEDKIGSKPWIRPLAGLQKIVVQ